MNKLIAGVALFALALGVPLALLMKHVYDQLRMEAYLQVTTDAADLAARIDRHAQEILADEENRRFEDFTFLNVYGNEANNFLQLSPLSKFPSETRLPGIVGYFQLDPDGVYTSPLLPRDGRSPADVRRFGIEPLEFQQRQARETEVLKILNQNDIAKEAGPAATTNAEATFAKSKVSPPMPKSFGKDAEAPYQEMELASVSTNQRQMKKMKPKAYEKRTQKVVVADVDGAPMQAADSLDNLAGVGGSSNGLSKDGAAATAMKAGEGSGRQRDAVHVRTFQGELDPFQMGILSSGHIVLYRKVWREGRRYIQGALMEREAFLDAMVRETFDATPLAEGVALVVHQGDEVLASYGAAGASQRLVAKHPLSAPFEALTLYFTVNQLQVGPSVTYVASICALLVIVMVVGMAAIFLAGRRQLALAQQQRDFVSAVSHELKTPLTSIRMYSEMLREGWAAEEKKRSYYDFIFAESERLSRLIANVLQLAGLSRGQTLTLQEMPASEAYRRAAEVTLTQTVGAGFTRKEQLPDVSRKEARLKVDPDALTQIMVNLVDNAIKFSRKTGQTTVETGFDVSPTGSEVRFVVRDFGPGIPKDQLKRIFKLFYRPENELTRTTKGTGIGLALVHELAAQMGGRVDVESQPGRTEFRVILPTA